MMNNVSSKRGRKERRAVGAIIGGVILAAIMVTTVLVYFLTILNNEKAKTAYELDAAQTNQDQAAEKMLVVRATELSSTNIAIRIDNEGSQSLVLSKLLLYCISAGCPSPPSPEPSIESPALTLNGGESNSRLIGPVQNGLTYRIDVISERGNIVSAKECKVNFGAGICENDPGDGGEEEVPPCLTCAVNEGIVQGTGSLQLDFRAFGSIYPQLGARDGIDQRGWSVKTASSYGNVTGYPAFEIPYQAHVFFVERVRNLDPSGEDISLTRKTALITNQGTIPPGQQSIIYLCSINPAGSDGVDAYNEATTSKLIPNTPIFADKFVGWEEIVFCTENPGSDYIRGNDSCGSSAASTGYCPAHTNEQLNGIIMVARGAFTSTLSQYGQTIPYQSAQPGFTAFTNFYWCLYDTPLGVACPAPMTASAAGPLIYTESSTSMSGGVTIYAHYRGTSDSLPTPPATITWIEPNGNTTILANNQILDALNNIPITLPQTYSDGSPLDCDGNASEDFIIKVNDSYSADGTRNVYYMTFRMTCP